MAQGDIKRIVQIGQNTSTPQQINEAFRQVSTWVNLLEGRSGTIELRDAIQSITSGTQAFANTSESLPDASFGVFYSGVNGTDCWLASGAKLVGENEWVALKTRAAMLKLSNSAGPISYFNTGLTPGASFIPIAQSTGPQTPHWGAWKSNTSYVAPGPSPIDFDQEIFADPVYFLSHGTSIEILVDGLYEIAHNGGGTVGVAENGFTLTLTGGAFSNSTIYDVIPATGSDQVIPATVNLIASMGVGDSVVVTLQNPTSDLGPDQFRYLQIKLLQS